MNPALAVGPCSLGARFSMAISRSSSIASADSEA